MKRQYLIFIAILFYINLHGQDNESIFFEKKIDSLLVLAEQYYDTEPKKSEQIYKLILNKESPNSICSNSKAIKVVNYLTVLYYINEDYIKAKQNAEIILDCKNNSTASSDFMEGISNLVVIYQHLGQLEMALDMANRSLNLLNWNKEANNQVISNSLQNISSLYYLLNDYDSAILFCKKAVNIRAQDFEYDLEYQIDGLADLGWYYTEIDNVDSSKYYYDQALKLTSDEKSYLFNKISLDKIDLLISKGKLEIADSLIIRINQNFSHGRLDNLKSRFYELKALNQSKLKKLDQAIRSSGFSIKYLKYQNNRSGIPRIFRNAAKIRFIANENKSALSYCDTSLYYCGINPDGFPNFESNIDFFTRKSSALKTLILKAQILQSKYKKSEDVEELKAALATYELALELAKRMRQDILSQGSKQKLAGDIFPVYEGGIEVALALFRLTGEEMYQEKAFRFAESNKSILLLESINESVAKSYSGIPDSLLDADKSLRTEIAFYEKSINEEKAQRDTTKIDYQKIKQWKNTLFDLKNEYQTLIRVLEKDYPRYYELKYETKLATLKELQQNILSPTDAMLELFVGDRNIYVFAVTQNQVHIETISKPEDFEKQFEVFFYHTKNPQKSKKDRDPALALKGQYDFYADYLEGAMSTLPDGIKRLIIIPDDMFSFLPFEIFLSSPPQKMNKPRFSLEYHDYLIEQYSFTYNYSATLLQKSYAERKGPKAKHFLLAMAPRFLKNNQVASRDAERVCTINDIGNLGCTDEEIEQITDMVGGKALLDYDANMEAFNQMASEYKIIHLATHSCPDEENPMNSRIFLADGALTNYDLFNYNLSAEMAVLSACNTGFGKFVKGEGVMPLSKGFIHAGVPSTIASTWPVEDCGTAEIMTLFYKYLKEGLAKDEALRQAKLQFMRESNNLFRQPYFWSPLIHVGNVEPIEVPYRTPTWVYWSAAGLLLLMGGRVLWQRQRQTQLAA